jgi:subtilase family serine protease
MLCGAFAMAVACTVFATPYPRATTPEAVDLGVAENIASANQVSVTVALKLRNTEQLNALVQAVYSPGNAQYHHFLTTPEFAARFGPTAATIAQVTKHFEAAGLTVSQTATAQLRVTGSAAAVQREFGTELHAYEVPATADAPAYRYHSPLAGARFSSEIAGAVDSVLGLDTRPRFRPRALHSNPAHAQRFAAVAARNAAAAKTGSTAPATTDPPGDWTVVDFAEYYDVNPLYKSGLDGHKQTIGIMTFASFRQSDVFAYWNALGLNVSGSRVKEVLVDGGSGPPSDNAGSDETTLDVEQSGGLAPGAQILVYEAPNTNQGFVDVFAAAIDKNAADTLSMSWGDWEYQDTFSVTDPNRGRTTTALRAINNLLIQAALQGQTVFTSSDDDGAYVANDVNFFPVPQFSKVLSVDDPATQPYITATGGTTLPGPQVYQLTATNQLITINIATEQAWGYDYLIPLCNALGLDPVSCGIFPGGSGGGVSVEWPLPWYQFGIAGTARSAPGQVLTDNSQNPPQVIAKLPANYRGRNVPDISVNSDPDTGYLLYYTSDTGFVPFISDFWGGTSFAAPQFNGVTALINQSLGHRVGFLNYALYNLVRFNAAYGGRNPPLRDIVHGDNWFYQGRPGYDPATGVGVPNFANLLQALRNPFFFFLL